jgi:hypothetical protein
MPQVTCRCGERLSVRLDSPDRIECPKCGARIRLRREAIPKWIGNADDGYLRFRCLCGRRLKVLADGWAAAGKCPDCGRVIPVPRTTRLTAELATGKKGARRNPDARTEDMDSDDLARLERWAARHFSQSSRTDCGGTSTPAFVPTPTPGTDLTSAGLPRGVSSVVKFEAGLRLCPRCQKPVHLGASICLGCGTVVPRG